MKQRCVSSSLLQRSWSYPCMYLMFLYPAVFYYNSNLWNIVSLLGFSVWMPSCTCSVTPEAPSMTPEAPSMTPVAPSRTPEAPR